VHSVMSIFECNISFLITVDDMLVVVGSYLFPSVCSTFPY